MSLNAILVPNNYKLYAKSITADLFADIASIGNLSVINDILVNDIFANVVTANSFVGPISGSSTSTKALETTGADVNVSLAAPPSAGQVLIANSATDATWQNMPVGDWQTGADAVTKVRIGDSAVADSDNQVALLGNVPSTHTNGIAIGDGAVVAGGTHAYSIAIGSGANNSNSYSTAIGTDAESHFGNSTAIGRGTNANGESSFAAGHGAVTGGFGGVGIGYNASCGGTSSTCVGNQSVVSATAGTAIGNFANCGAIDGLAIGKGAISSAYQWSVAVGPNARATISNETISIGHNPLATGYAATAIGFNASSSGGAGIAIGSGASSSGDAGIAIGLDTVASQPNQVSMPYFRINNRFITTSDATPTNLDLYYFGTAITGNSAIGTVYVSAFEAATDDYKLWSITGIAGIKTSAATPVGAIGTVNSLAASAGAAAWTLSGFLSGVGTYRITVTGEAAHNIDWTATGSWHTISQT